jgi:hypothetical protein
VKIGAVKAILYFKGIDEILAMSYSSAISFGKNQVCEMSAKI